MRTLLILIFSIALSGTARSQEIAVLKYQGGGDWYANPTALPNLIRFCNTHLKTRIKDKPATVDITSDALYDYPFMHMTGHGNVFFSEEDARQLRTYLLGGGFLHIDDNYGMRPYLEKELKKVFPNKTLVPIGKDHPIFHQTFEFPNGLPKIHEHDGLPPEALGIFHDNRLVLLFTFESDLGDGWENPEVHNDPEEVRLKALRMGANIIQYAFEN